MTVRPSRTESSAKARFRRKRLIPESGSMEAPDVWLRRRVIHMETSAISHFVIVAIWSCHVSNWAPHVYRSQHHPRAPVCHKGLPSVNQASTMVRARQRRPDRRRFARWGAARAGAAWPNSPTPGPCISARAYTASKPHGRPSRCLALCYAVFGCDAGARSLAQYSNEPQRGFTDATAVGTFSAFVALGKIAQAETPPPSARFGLSHRAVLCRV